ncbi:MAG TPA: hypothetical protein VNQ77_04400 [Frankiaceae bacterium]|nr:hypothetical protein [Frankiaceae bacterium]
MLLPLVLAATAAPAVAEAKGTVVIVADGPSIGTFTLPETARLDFFHAVVRSEGTYAVIVGTSKHGRGWGGRLPGYPFSHNVFFDYLRGKVTLRLLARGRTTFTVPASGMSGRRVLRLTTPLRDTVASFESLPATGASAVTNTIRFITRGPALVINGYDANRPDSEAEVAQLCVVAPGLTCPVTETPNHLWTDTNTTAHGKPRWMHQGGEYDAKMIVAEAGTFTGPVKHYVLAVPSG